MLTFSGGLNGDPIPIGHRAIIFVAHSMGGLVVKKAYLLGKHDPDYTDMISQVYGIIFLATPHRGAQYAKVLNNILSTAPLGAPPKAYVADLDAQSTTVQDINEQFRVACRGLALVSFFETLKTSLGITKTLIVEKDSAVLGYPQEISTPLHADHHNICKFSSPEDGNFVNVKNALKLFATRMRPIRQASGGQRLYSNNSTRTLDIIKKIEDILGIHEPAEIELNTIRSRVLEGTCEWITRRRDYISWIETRQNPRTFWLIGPPATGKTTLASTVVEDLQSLGENCQYHFFSSNHQAKRTAAYCLRSIAFQLAITNQEFRARLFALHEDSGVTFTSQNQNFKVIWEKIFEGVIFKMRFHKPPIWVLDAVDEGESQSLLVSHLLGIDPMVPIKFFLTSRPMKMPSMAAADNLSIVTCFLSEEDTINDIRTYVCKAVREALPNDEHIQEDIIEQILTKASGSFLWVRLALETLQDNWHTQEDIEKILTEMPKGMESLYQRMLDMVKSQPPRLQLMAKRILTWATCCWRPLSIVELKIALEPEFKGFVRLEDTIVQICGHFISVDGSKISLTHITARHFLLNDCDDVPAFINEKQGHEHIARVCLKYLSNDNWRRVFKKMYKSNEIMSRKIRMNRLLLANEDYPFLIYATCYWAYHLSKSSLNAHELMGTLKVFFNRYCLTWIEAVALSSDLRYLTRSAQYLKTYAKRRSRKSNLDPLDSSLTLEEPLEDDTNRIRLWATDFIRVLGKFGPNLVQSPSSVYRLIPPFCPRDSMINKTYHIFQYGTISVTGLSSDGWDDCLASVNVGNDETASKVLATEAYFVTLVSSSGTVVIWYAETCEQARRIHHEEYVPLMVLNRSRIRLATAGVRSYRIWDISSGKELYRLPKVTQALTMAIAFGGADSELVVGLDDHSVTCYDLETSQQLWRFIPQNLRKEFQSCPRVMAFSPDLKKVAVAWRGMAPAVWDMTAPQDQHPQRCMVRSSTDAVCGPEQIEWQTDGNSILILCQNTMLVEWNLYDEEQIEFDHLNAREMTVSQDGNFLLTSDNMGVMSVWTFPRLHLLYRLVNRNAFIRDLAFSPDGQRFYDTRGSICNVWEPAALARPEEHDLEDESSAAESYTATEPVISNDESSQNQVTALACDSEDRYYCCGREDGSVIIHEAASGRKVRKVYNHTSTSSIVALAWSRSGHYMVSGDDSGRVVAKRLEVKEAGKWSVFPVLDFRLDETVQQFLFSDDEKLLLISALSTDRVWDLRAKKELCYRHWGVRQSRRWVQHPLNVALLISIDLVEVHTYNWATLEHNDIARTLSGEPATLIQTSGRTQALTRTSTHGRLVQWITLTSDKRYLVYEIVPDSSQSGTSSSEGLQLELLSTSDLGIQQPDSLTSTCMADLAGQVRRLIGTYQDRIVFLDHEYWLCTLRIEAGVSDVMRHFFLPKDWLNAGSLQLAAMNPQGTFFCPKYGHVAVVRHGMRF